MKDSTNSTPALMLCIPAEKLTKGISDILEIDLEMFPVFPSRVRNETVLQEDEML